MTTDAPATVADLHGPHLPTRHATAGSISARSPAEVFDALESSSQGLAAARAASRLAALGPNELRAAKRPPVIKKVLAQFTNLFALVLLGASGSMPASLRICHTVDGATFAAGAGAGSGAARKDSVDRAACVLMADVAERARYPYRPSPRSPADAHAHPAEHAPGHLPAVTTTIRNACHASSPADSPTGWHQDAVHCPASADPEPVAAVAPGEADADGSIHDVSAS